MRGLGGCIEMICHPSILMNKKYIHKKYFRVFAGEKGLTERVGWGVRGGVRLKSMRRYGILI